MEPSSDGICGHTFVSQDKPTEICHLMVPELMLASWWPSSRIIFFSLHYEASDLLFYWGLSKEKKWTSVMKEETIGRAGSFVLFGFNLLALLFQILLFGANKMIETRERRSARPRVSLCLLDLSYWWHFSSNRSLMCAINNERRRQDLTDGLLQTIRFLFCHHFLLILRLIKGKWLTRESSDAINAGGLQGLRWEPALMNASEDRLFSFSLFKKNKKEIVEADLLLRWPLAFKPVLRDHDGHR